MIDFKNIQEHEIERPNVWTCLGSPEDFDALSDEIKDQIKFLDEEASNFYTPILRPLNSILDQYGNPLKRRTLNISKKYL